MGTTLEPERVDPRIDHQPDQRQQARQPVAACPEQAEAADAQGDGIADGGGHRDGPQRQRAMAGPHHAPIDVSIGAVVNDATATDHQCGAEQRGQQMRGVCQAPAAGEEIPPQHRREITENNPRLGQLNPGIEQPQPVPQ
ncbi:hypothetical protein TU73_17435 [Pseudomonas libanensis]|uniref:Uncharacterized protein n=1 Tax=Pseudomonas libanensis TaxID=75588 RepID=A0A0R2Y5D0_9PSED|nr:hypothetical protein TU73_17435 [Pseudomonas libanensis]